MQQQLLCVVNAIFREGGKVHGPQLKNVDMSLGIIILSLALWREGVSAYRTLRLLTVKMGDY